MIVCDQRDCTARATRELRFDSGLSLWSCSHHCSDWIPSLPADVRFSPEPATIWA